MCRKEKFKIFIPIGKLGSNHWRAIGKDSDELTGTCAVGYLTVLSNTSHVTTIKRHIQHYKISNAIANFYNNIIPAEPDLFAGNKRYHFLMMWYSNY